MAIEDIVWGQNRHVFGGIEPSNMIAFVVEPRETTMLINAIPPKDTVINDQTVCTVAGVVIRRSDDHYPVDEFDGDEVATIRGHEQFVFGDPDADPKGTYYYAAFPFSTQNVYNRNPINRFTANKPDKLDLFTAKSGYDDASGKFYITVDYTLPATIAGAKIVGSKSDYPTNPSEGAEICDVTENGSFTFNGFDGDSLEEGSTLYLSAFSYSSNRHYNLDEYYKVSVTVVKFTYYYGYDINTKDSNPDSRVTYPTYTDAVGASGTVVHNAKYTPAGIDSSGVFTYGSWMTAGFMPKPCMLEYDGTVAYYLDPDDYTKKIDGTPSDISNLDFEGNAMMEWPKIWTKRWEENDVYHFRCCDRQLDESFECWCNYDRNGNEIPYFYTSIYRGMTASEDTLSGRLRSISGTTYCLSSPSMSISDMITKAKENGDDWTTEVLADRLLINDLLVLMGKTTNLEQSFGNGKRGDNTWTGTICGGTDNEGLFNGVAKKSTVRQSLKIFGMEDWWGCGNRFIAGWVEVNKVLKLKLTRGTTDGSTATDYNTSGEGYLTVYENLSTYSSASDYIIDCDVKSYGRFPLLASSTGSSSTYECDLIRRASTSGTKVLTISGSGPNIISTNTKPLNSEDGPFKLSLISDVTSDNSGIATGLSCKPAKK